jgi:protein SCO1/2
VPAPAVSFGEPISAAEPAAVRDAVLVSSTGQRFDIASLRGKIVVLSDMMTLCQESCPLDTANLVAAARAVQAAGLSDRFAFLSLTIDPVRDDLRHLAAYRSLYRPAPADWTVATGTPSGVAALWKTLGTVIKRVPDGSSPPHDWLTHAPLHYDLTHSDEVFFFDAAGTERFLLEGVPHVAAGAPIPSELRRFMDGEGRQNLRHPQPGAWTLPQLMQVLSWLAGHNITS